MRIVRVAGIRVEEQLDELKKAPLKPHHRMTLLREHVLMGAQHALVLGSIRRATLRRMDQVVRAAVRRFLHLPKDAPSAFIHAHPTDGGLGVPELRYQVPMARAKRLEALTQTINVQVVSDNADLSQDNQRMISYYDNAAIREEAHAGLATLHPVEVGAATLSWRGCWSKESAHTLRELGLTNNQLALISLRVVENTYTI